MTLENGSRPRSVATRATRRAPIAAAATLPAVLAAGCGTFGAAPAAPAKTLEPQLVKIWVPFGDQQFNFEGSWADFVATHPGWTREIAYDVANVKFVTSVTAGDAPDVFMQPSMFLLDAAAKGMIRPLDQYISRDKVDWKQYYAAGKIGAEYRQKHYGLPHHVDVYSVYGNEKVLREGAIDAKKKPASWDELMAANTRLIRQGAEGQTTRMGFIPFYGVSPFVLYYFPANGAPLVSADGTKVGFDNAAGLEVLEWMSNAIKTLGGWDRIQAYRGQFANGENGVGWALGRDAVGYGYVGCWNLGFRVFKENPNAEIVQWHLPGGPSAKGKEFGQYIAMHTVIPTESKKPDAGWQFVMHDTSPAGQKHIQWNFGSFDISSIPSVANNADSLKLQPWRKRMHELMADAKEPSFFPHPGSGDIGTAITNAIQPFLKGEEGPKATMDALKRDVERLMAQFRVP
jgi:multiple sugar transport system substrate-binding protein